MRELLDLEIDHHVTLESCVVEDEVRVEVVAIQREPALPADEGEACTEFEQELPEMRDQGTFEIPLRQPLRLRQIQELQDIGVLEHIQWVLGRLSLARQLHHAGLVPALEEALVVESVNLALELAFAPTVLRGLNLIERTGGLVVYPHQGAVVGPAQVWVEALV